MADTTTTITPPDMVRTSRNNRRLYLIVQFSVAVQIQALFSGSAVFPCKTLLIYSFFLIKTSLSEVPQM